MKIALIGPGIMPIPPVGWGAVEILIWDYYNSLKQMGHQVTIFNTKNIDTIIKSIEGASYDFVHIHYDVFYQLMPYLDCPKIAITSHYPYIDKREKHLMDGYGNIFDYLVKQREYYNFVLADKDADMFIRCGADRDHIRKIKNGINSSMFRFSEEATLDKTVYLGKITPRKNQALFQDIENIDFIGNCHDVHFKKSRYNYLGEWSRVQIYNKLTEYTNLLLISDGEADPLVVKEALIAGLGVVINRSSAENLDRNLKFITVIDDDKIGDISFITRKLAENKEIAKRMRAQIREYGVQTFDIETEVKKYVEIIENLL